MVARSPEHARPSRPGGGDRSAAVGGRLPRSGHRSAIGAAPISLLLFLITAFSPIPASAAVILSSMTGPITGINWPFMVYLPPGYDDDDTKRYPVIYHLHQLNRNYRAGSVVHVEYDNYIRNGSMPEVIIIFPDGLVNSMWADSFDGSKPVETHIIRELIPYIDRKYRTVASRDGRIVQGFSMGGYGAMLYAIKFPEMFAADIAFDGALHQWKDMPNPIREDIFDNSEQYYHSYDLFGFAANTSSRRLYSIELMLMIGDLTDLNNNFAAQMDQLRISYVRHDTSCEHGLYCLATIPVVPEFIENVLSGGYAGCRCNRRCSP